MSVDVKGAVSKASMVTLLHGLGFDVEGNPYEELERIANLLYLNGAAADVEFNITLSDLIERYSEDMIVDMLERALIAMTAEKESIVREKFTRDVAEFIAMIADDLGMDYNALLESFNERSPIATLGKLILDAIKLERQQS